MRQRLATIFITCLLTGCSLLYNPNNLPPPPAEAGPGPDMMVDELVILDTNPDALELIGLDQIEIVEGTGDGESAPMLLVVRGRQMVQNNTTVVIEAFDGTSDITPIVVDNTQVQVDDTGTVLVVPVKFTVDPLHDRTAAPTRLAVTVRQMGVSGPVSASIPDEVMFHMTYLSELTNASPELVGNKLAPNTSEAPYLYSMVSITSGGLSAMANTSPLFLRAIASIDIVGSIDVSANGVTAGPGGFGGGAGGPGSGGVGGSPPGGTGGGDGGGTSPGGGGGYGTAAAGAGGGPMAGDEALEALDSTNRGSGGGGGVGGSLLAMGGAGGAGGGTIEITAGGKVTLGTVISRGGNGASTNTSDGGGGSGGSILIRGNTVTTTSVTAPGGSPGTGNGADGSAGAVGRIRIDTTTILPTTTPAAFRGPTFAPTMPRVVRTKQPMIQVVGKGGKPFNWVFEDASRSTARTGRETMPSTGMTSFMLPEPLFDGLNHFCLIVDGGDGASPAEAKNCYELVFLYEE